mmetsp:Transcript_13332/g.28184  ORF Transcript_13332/g.28184 Transcript_13332/m.28184 type:complete len:116 (-) Transcript_13332:127-474(-)
MQRKRHSQQHLLLNCQRFDPQISQQKSLVMSQFFVAATLAQNKCGMPLPQMPAEATLVGPESYGCRQQTITVRVAHAPKSVWNFLMAHADHSVIQANAVEQSEEGRDEKECGSNI